MTYSKPDLTLIGKAVVVIEGSKNPPTAEAPNENNPAYDLDE